MTTYNTGRTVTINLDTLGNADIWQLFTIVTDGTNNVFEGDKPDAAPRADSTAAMEIFLHIAETADARTKGYCDAAQRHFLEGAKESYIDIFDTDPADDLRKRLEEEGHEENAPKTVRLTATPGDFHEIEEQDDPTEDPELDTWDKALIWLDGSPRGYDGWEIVEEAARIQSIATHDDPSGRNLFMAGRIYGMAAALATAARIEGAHADWWMEFITDFAADNYDNGSRVE